MKAIFLTFAALSSAIASSPNYACSANYTSEVSAREFMGEHTVSQENVGLSINEDGSGILDHLGLATCKFNREWHCITGAGLNLYLPRSNALKKWNYEGFRYIKEERELMLFNKRQLIYTITAYQIDKQPVAGTLAPHSIYLFNKKMELVGYTIKMTIDPEIQASSFFTFYLHDGRMPAACF